MVEWFLDEKFIEVQIFLGLFRLILYNKFKIKNLITLSEYLNNYLY